MVKFIFHKKKYKHFKIKIILKKTSFWVYCIVGLGQYRFFVNIFSLYLANIYTFITHILNGRYLIDTIKIQCGAGHISI